MIRVDKHRAYSHILDRLPALSTIVDRTGKPSLPGPSDTSISDALACIVAGQMLSQQSAQSIIERMRQRAADRELHTLVELPIDELRACGLSGRKAKTISIIAELVREQPNRFECWRDLEFGRLRSEVCTIWGLSDWSASMLAIFHLGHEDVFPLSDGSIVRAVALVEQSMPELSGTDWFSDAAPYRSYLAVTLWAALDSGLL